jgi:ADP-ribose pyrophosphatase
MIRRQRRLGSESSLRLKSASINTIMAPQQLASPVIRKGPLGLAVALLFFVPTLVFLSWNTELSEAERRSKLRDISGGHPRVDDSGPYTGGTLWKTDQTLGKVVLGETPYARCEVHSVMQQMKHSNTNNSSQSNNNNNNNNNNKMIVNDWIFMEERDAVNVVVVTKEGKFLVFSQRKYAIPGETLAPVGGFINNGEAPFDAARREVREELGVGSQRTKEILNEGSSLVLLESAKETKEAPFGTSKTPVQLDEYGLLIGNVPHDEATSWVFLGKYRTMANRGGGFVYSYLLKDSVPLVGGGGTSAYVNSGDAEVQDLHLLSLGEVKDAVMQGRFQEVKWAATVALGLLHLDKQ